MPLPLIILASLGGLAIAVGIGSLIDALSDRGERVARWFSLFSLVFATYVFLQMGISASGDPVRVAALLRWQGLAAALALAVWPWLGVALAGRRSDWLDRLLSVLYAGLGLWSLGSPCGYWFSSLDRIRTLAVAGGVIYQPRGPLAPTYFVSILAQYVLFGRQLGHAWRMARAGSRLDGWLWGASQIALVLASLHDHAVDLALLRGPYLAEYVFPLFMVWMAIWLSVRRSAAHVALRRAQTAQVASEARFRDVFENSGDALFIHDADTGEVLDVNRTGVEMYGWSREECRRLTVADLSADRPEYSPDVARERLAEAASHGQATFEWMARRRDGGCFPVEVALKRTAVAGQPCILAAVRDATARKRAEEEQARLSRAVAQAGESVVITDPEGTIVYVNPAFERITGYTRAEALGQNPRILKSGRHDGAFYGGMWDTLVKGGVWSGRLVNRRKDGTLFDEDATIGPVRDASGRLVNYVAVKRDVSREVLLQQQLLASQRIEAVGRLAGGVAHDFNNLLFVIMSYGEMVFRGLPAENPLKGKVKQIIKAADRAAGLTRQLLAFSRRQVLQPRTLDLNVIVSEMGSMLQRVIGERIEMVTRLEPGLASVRADPGQLEQVIMNLVVNARDAMPDGGRLVVQTRNADVAEDYTASQPLVSPKPYAMLAISDTGSGMSAETQAHIFEPFFTTKEVGKGTGLGLSTVYGIVKQSGGYIWVDSQLAVGTTFRIYLPAVDEVPENAEEREGGAALRLGSETVLLVEDETSVRDVLQATLQANGYRVLVAQDGEEALQIAAAHVDAIDLLVTDVIMPGMTGHEVAEQIAPKHPKMRVLYISGHADEAISRYGLISPGAAFLSKPFGTEVFLLRIRELLDRG